ncbi:uncharacterized protein LOC135103706 [Scylla paramamosain]|uniref:uncharacterized protein LOC135103706 n=1 Tax=Scylla paramamosain TaxID=85552 RepID=UPI003083E93A
MKSYKNLRNHNLLALLVLMVFASVKGCLGLRVRQVVVPSHEVKGKKVDLECRYDLEGDKLYSVKWYKGIKEFFRYVPADNPPIQVFSLPGVSVDTDKSNSKKLTLKEVSLKTSGKYKCEVSAEAPSFHTDSGTGQLLVVHIPEKNPDITGIRSKYQVGDVVQVNCTSSPSWPAAALLWYINDEPAEMSSLVDYAPITNEKGLETSILGLHFRASSNHLKHGMLKLRCTATIAAVYYRENTCTAGTSVSQLSDIHEIRSLLDGGATSLHAIQGWSAVTGIVLLLLR